MTTTIHNVNNDSPLRIKRSMSDGLGDYEVELVGKIAGGRNYKAQDLFDALRAEGFVDDPKTTAQKVAELEPGVRFHSSREGGLHSEVVYVKLANGHVLQSTTGAIFAPNVFTAGYSFTEIG